jgi:hypothetical protein
MIERIQNGKGYKMADMLYELCECQADITILREQLECLTARIDKKASRKPKEPMKDGA